MKLGTFEKNIISLVTAIEEGRDLPLIQGGLVCWGFFLEK